MKYAAFIAVLAASTATAKRSCLTAHEAKTIVDKFISVLEGQDYNGQAPNVTAAEVVAANYQEYSDSILSLEKQPLADTPSATSETQWYDEVSQYPDAGIQTLDILHSCHKIAWYWLFPQVGSGQYRVKGTNLLTINSDCQVERADIEFNSIAWGLDTQQLYEWCPNATSSAAASSTASSS